MGDHLVGEHWVLGVHQRKGEHTLLAVITKETPSQKGQQSDTHNHQYKRKHPYKNISPHLHKKHKSKTLDTK